MLSRRPAASTSTLTICRSRAVRPRESNGILTSGHFATRCSRSEATTSFDEAEPLALAAGIREGCNCNPAPDPSSTARAATNRDMTGPKETAVLPVLRQQASWRDIHIWCRWGTVPELGFGLRSFNRKLPPGNGKLRRSKIRAYARTGSDRLQTVVSAGAET